MSFHSILFDTPEDQSELQLDPPGFFADLNLEQVIDAVTSSKQEYDGAQESIMRAVVGQLAPPDRRGSAYGLFNAVYGVAWFAGSVTIGLMYEWSIPALVAFSVVVQLLAIPLLLLVRRYLR